MYHGRDRDPEAPSLLEGPLAANGYRKGCAISLSGAAAAEFIAVDPANNLTPMLRQGSLTELSKTYTPIRHESRGQSCCEGLEWKGDGSEGREWLKMTEVHSVSVGSCLTN